MGSNTYHRKKVSDDEIKKFVEFALENPLHSIYKQHQFTSEKQWRADVSRYLDRDSCNRFYYKLLIAGGEEFFCSHCSAQLGIESFNYTGWNQGMSKYCIPCTKKGVWRSSLSEQQLADRGKKISQAKIAFYQTDAGVRAAKKIGLKNSIALKEFYQTEQGRVNIENSRKRNSTIMKDKILSGEFTPNSNNRNTHWDAYYNNKKYRSSWEALYQYFNPDALYEKLRIAYSFNGKEKIYIIDFIDYTNNIVAEVKPEELCCGEQFEIKINALKRWALDNNFTVRLAGRDYFRTKGVPLDWQKFDSSTKRKILKIYE